MKIGGLISQVIQEKNARDLPLILKDERAFFRLLPCRAGTKNQKTGVIAKKTIKRSYSGSTMKKCSSKQYNDHNIPTLQRVE